MIVPLQQSARATVPARVKRSPSVMRASTLDQIGTGADPRARGAGDLQRRAGRVNRLQLIQRQLARLEDHVGNQWLNHAPSAS